MDQDELTETGDLSLGQAVGAAVRSIRQDSGVTADALARTAVRVGLPWHRATITSLESGKRGLSGEELLLLPLVLSLATKKEVPLLDLFRADVALTPAAVATPRGIEEVLHGERATVGPHGGWYFRLPRPDFERFKETVRREMELFPPEVTAQVFDAAEDLAAGRIGEAEHKAARKLRRHPAQVLVAARVRWKGLSLTEERDRRVRERLDPHAPQPTVQAVRGRVTRELLAELAPDLEQYPIQEVRTARGKH